MNLDGRTILITGSTDGVGRQVALTLAAAGANVLVHGRNAQRGQLVLDAIRTTGNGRGRFYVADFSSLTQVRELAAAIRRDHGRLDVLINNAGIGGVPAAVRARTSADGHELRFAVNYLAGFLLTLLLFPLGIASAPARIVNVGSPGQPASTSTTSCWICDPTKAAAPTPRASSPISCSRSTGGGARRIGCHRQLPASRDLHGHDDGAGSRSGTDEHGGGRRRCDHASCGLAGARGPNRPLLRPHPAARANPQAYDRTARERLRALSFELTGLAPTLQGATRVGG